MNNISKDVIKLEQLLSSFYDFDRIFYYLSKDKLKTDGIVFDISEYRNNKVSIFYLIMDNFSLFFDIYSKNPKIKKNCEYRIRENLNKPPLMIEDLLEITITTEDKIVYKKESTLLGLNLYNELLQLDQSRKFFLKIKILKESDKISIEKPMDTMEYLYSKLNILLMHLKAPMARFSSRNNVHYKISKKLNKEILLENLTPYSFLSITKNVVLIKNNINNLIDDKILLETERELKYRLSVEKQILMLDQEIFNSPGRSNEKK